MSSRKHADLQENFSKQQKKISALKELVRKSEVDRDGKSASVKNIAQRLAKLNPKSTNLSPTDVTISAESQHDNVLPTPAQTVSSSTPTPAMRSFDGNVSGSEKILLLRQQMEQNRALMAQRASSKQHLEQLVTQLKEKFDTTQQSLEDTTELGRSMGDLSILGQTPVSRGERHRSSTDLQSTQPAFSLERERIKFLENRCRLLEKQLDKERQGNNTSLHENPAQSLKRVKELEQKVLELEQSLREKEQEIEEKHAIEDKLSEKMELLDNSNNEENTTKNVDDMNEVIKSLRLEVETHLKRIVELEELNDMLGTTHDDMSIKCNKFQELLREKEDELLSIRETVLRRDEELENADAKCARLQNELDNFEKSSRHSPAINTDTQVKTEMAKQIQELQDELLQLRAENAELQRTLKEKEQLGISDESIAEKISLLESTIESQRQDLQARFEANKQMEEELMEKTVELNVLNANYKVLEEKLQGSSKTKPLFSVDESGANSELQAEIQSLKQKLDESNKAMIKLKLKAKQTEKQMEKLKKSSVLHAEVIRLGQVNEELQQQLTELEDEKGQWQLASVDVDVPSKQAESEKTHELEGKCAQQLEIIEQLKSQEMEAQATAAAVQRELEELRQSLKQQHDDEQIARVKTEISGIQLEEQLEMSEKEVIVLKERLQNAETAADEHKRDLIELKQQKQELDKKLEHYLAENMELMDKMNKLSKSSSSAESIEIVERLTNQERAEMDELTKRLDGAAICEAAVGSSVNELTQTEMGPELSESLVKLREESSELMKKIELFTTERREVMEKMENLTAENNTLLKKIEDVVQQKQQLEANAVLAEGVKLKLELRLQELTKEKELLALQVSESSAQKSQLSQELTSMQKSSEVVAALDCAEGASLFDKCEKSLAKLNSELESYRKANDKNAKFNASKKLAKEAKNAYTQLSELLEKVKDASTAVETVTVVETVVAVTAPNGKALAEYEQLTMQNRELKARIEDLMQELQSMREEMADGSSVVVVPALTDNSSTANVEALRLQEALQKVCEYEEQVKQLESVVAEVRRQLEESKETNVERTSETARLVEELQTLRTCAEEFDKRMSDSKLSYEHQIGQLTRLRLQLEAKCETYEGEMEILQTLVAEQKQQTIEAYKEHEHEMNVKLLDLQDRDAQIAQLRLELQQVKQTSQNVGLEAREYLQLECEKLRESLKISQALAADQVNKQETIDTLNEQLIELYKTIEDNANGVMEKDDEISTLNELLETKANEIERLQKDNDEQKNVVDKLLSQLHTHKTSTTELHNQLVSDLQSSQADKKRLEAANEELQRRNKDQLDKLKKYAANLKKRTTHCLELEERLKDLEKSDTDKLDSNLEKSVNELNEKLTNSEQIVNELQEALYKKTLECSEGNDKIVRLETNIQQLQKDYEEKRQEVFDLENALASLLSVHSDCKSNVDNEKSQIEVSEKQELASKLSEKSVQLEISEAALANLQFEMLQLKKVDHDRDQAIRELHFEIESKNAEIANLSKQLAAVAVNENKANEERLEELLENLKTKSLKFEKSKAVIKERNNQIHRLQSQLKDLQDKLCAQPEWEPQTELEATPNETSVAREEYEALKVAYDKLNEQYDSEKSNFLLTINRLETLHDSIQAKLQEDMSYIESLEQENNKFKEKICKLEECVGTFEERRSSMERRANLLDAQMQTRADEYVKTEDELIYRLNMLADHDDLIGQRLLSSQEEKDELQERFDRVNTDLKALQTKYANLEKEQYQNNKELVTSLEQECSVLREKLSTSEKELQHIRSVYDAKLAAKTTELDELECGFSDQLETMNAEKRSISEALEMSRDECNELKDEMVRLKEKLNALEQAKHELDRETTWLRMQNENSQQDQYDLQELRMQTLQDKTEIDNLRAQIETLAANHDIELQALRTQITELDSLRMQVGQNQTDDQVFIETENKRLTDLLAEKDALIENYQRQNLQYQMAAMQQQQQSHIQPTSTWNAPAVDNFPSTFGMASNNPAGTEEHDRLENELTEKTELAATLQRDLNRLQNELQSLQEVNAEMNRQMSDKNLEIENLRSLGISGRSVASAVPTSTQNTNDVLIPAPAMFFNSEQMVHSPFDEIVQVRVNENLLDAAAPTSSGVLHEQPTIEDLQKNVSDLEKHAQDLENKLSLRNQREADYEERLYALQTHLTDAEARLRDREQQLQSLETKLRQIEESSIKSETERLLNQQHLEEVQSRLSSAQNELDLQNEKLKNLEFQLQQKGAVVTATNADSKVIELEKAVEELKEMLSVKEKLVDELQNSANEKLKHQQAELSLESQIIEEPILQQFQPTLDMFFGAPSGNDFDGFVIPKVCDEPVVEDAIVPKTAYVCQPMDQADVGVLNLNDAWGDEGWGDIDNEVKATHFATNMAATPSSTESRTRHLEAQLAEQERKLNELQTLLKSSEQQKQELHTKSGKIMKKLKEYKTKVEELQSAASAGNFKKSTSVDSSSMFDDLDAAIQEELKSQIQKLEEKLAGQLKIQENFVAEKEKLLKRIDVLTAGNDRMAEMKERQDMDVHMYQTRINELQSKLLSLEDWGNETAGEDGEKDRSQTITKTSIVDTVVSHDSKQAEETTEERISQLLSDNQELQALLEEEKMNCARAEDLVRNLQSQSNSTATDESIAKSNYNELLLKVQNLDSQCNDLQDTNLKLSSQVNAMKESENKFSELNTQLELRCEELQSELLALRTQHTELMQAKEELQELNEGLVVDLRRITEENKQLKEQHLLPTSTSNFDELSAHLQEKDAEIIHLKQRIEDLMREDQTEKLVLEILTKNQDIAMLKLNVKNLEHDKQELEHNLSLQVTKEMHREEESELQHFRNQLAELTEKVTALESHNKELEAEKKSMEEELQVLNNHVLNSIELEDKMKSIVLELDMKNIEIAELRKSLETMVTSNAGSNATTMPTQTADVAAINAQWETVVEQKCGEIAEMWRAHLEVRERDFKAAESRYKEENAALKLALEENVAGQTVHHEAILRETSGTPTTASDATTETGSQSSSNLPSKDGTPLRTRLVISENDSDSADAMLEKMQAALESQEMEIVTLKEQLAIRSAEYARLAAQYDPFQLKNAVSPSPSKRSQPENTSLVPKSELDLALYMLHQRTMRCEEMTHEIVSLLEERDTLQLKLSNTLRQVETIKTHTTHSGEANAFNSEVLETGQTATPATPDHYDTSNELSQKLSQLQTVNHSKDKVIIEEREQRIREMERIQQDVAKMPPAAVSELVGSDMSNTNQSPSSVLLNWLFSGNQSNSGVGSGSFPSNN